MFKKLISPLWLICALLIHTFLLLSTRFTLWPEILVYPYLINNGFSLYKDIINPYPPTLPFALSFFTKILGYDPASMQILTWTVIGILDLIIFYASKQIYKSNEKAMVSLLFFIFVSIPFGINGIWFDLIQTPFILLASLFLYWYLLKKNNFKLLIFASLFLAIAFFIKQQAIWAVAFFCFTLFIFQKSRKKLVRNVAFFASPFLVLFLVEILYMLKLNLLYDFFFWTFYLPFVKASSMPGYVLLPTLKQVLTVSLIFSIFTPTLAKKNIKNTFFVIAPLPLVLFAYPRFDYFHLIPAIAILSISFGQNIKEFLTAKFNVRLISVSSLILILIFCSKYYFLNWTNEIRFFEKDVYEASTLVKILNPQNRPVYLQNVSGQILVLSKTLPTKPWADSFPWYLEINGVQENIVRGILRDDPALIVSKPYENTGKYELSSYKPQLTVDFIDKNYKEIGKINESLNLKAKISQ